MDADAVEILIMTQSEAGKIYWVAGGFSRSPGSGISALKWQSDVPSEDFN